MKGHHAIQLILDYAEAARRADAWTATIQANQCPTEHLHARGSTLLTTGTVCKACRTRTNAMKALKQAEDARTETLERMRSATTMHERNN